MSRHAIKATPRFRSHVSTCLVLSLLIAAPSVAWATCDQAEHGQSEGSDTRGAKATPAIKRGAAIPDQPALSVATVLAKAAAFATKDVVVEGLVTRVCRRKGCWMELSQSESKNAAKTASKAAKKAKEAPRVRVTFKDYGFFVPKDTKPRLARVVGRTTVRKLSAKAVSHYQEEGARVQGKTPEGAAREVTFVATGVELL